jgi:hypothetical protein
MFHYGRFAKTSPVELRKTRLSPKRADVQRFFLVKYRFRRPPAVKPSPFDIRWSPA